MTTMDAVTITECQAPGCNDLIIEARTTCRERKYCTRACQVRAYRARRATRLGRSVWGPDGKWAAATIALAALLTLAGWRDVDSQTCHTVRLGQYYTTVAR
jgi:hypothetical protein